MNLNSTDLIALLAVVISALSFFYSIALNIKQGKYIKHQDELNNILLLKEKSEIEKQKFADLDAKVIKYGNSKYYIKVYNQGKARAYNVDFQMIDSEWMIMDHAFPLEYFEPSKSIELNLALSLNSEMKSKCLLTWEDESGPHTKEVILIV